MLVTAQDVREFIGDALRRARGSATVHSAGASGVGYRTVDRLERGAKQWVDLSTVYLLAAHYQISLGGLIRFGATEGGYLPPWPADAPSLPATDQHLRVSIRETRKARGMGSPALAKIAGIHQSWIVRYEAGEVRADLVRMVLMAEGLGMSLAPLLPGPFTCGEVDVGRRSTRKRIRTRIQPPAATAGASGPDPTAVARPEAETRVPGEPAAR